MEVNHCKNDSTIGKVAVYSVYNLGVSVIVGLARTIIAIVYIVKHTLQKEKYDAIFEQKQEKRQAEVNAAKAQTQGRSGLSSVLSKAQELGTRGKARWEAAGDRVTHSALGSYEVTLKQMWKEELYRGLAEMIPVFGSAYWTYQDNWSKGRKVESYLGFGELSQKIEMEGLISDKSPGALNTIKRYLKV